MARHSTFLEESKLLNLTGDIFRLDTCIDITAEPKQPLQMAKMDPVHRLECHSAIFYRSRTRALTNPRLSRCGPDPFGFRNGYIYPAGPLRDNFPVEESMKATVAGYYHLSDPDHPKKFNLAQRPDCPLLTV